MQYLIYVSTVPQPSSAAVQFDMLTLYAALMKRRDITGLLLYDQGVVMHYLEGEPDNLATVVKAMSNDRFQTNLEIILREPLARRRCPLWRMAYWAASPVAHPAYSPLLRDRTMPWAENLVDAPELVPLRNFRARAFGERSDTDPSAPHR